MHEYEDEEYFCSICNREYVDGELWHQCDKCSNWFQGACTNMSKRTKRQIWQFEFVEMSEMLLLLL